MSEPEVSGGSSLLERKKKRYSCSQLLEIICSKSSLIPWFLIIITLTAGILVTVLIHDALHDDEVERLSSRLLSAGVEGLYLAQQRLSSMSVLISTTTTAITIMSPSDWTRNNSYRLSNVASGQVASLAWWETYPVAEAELFERVEALREEYGFDADDPYMSLQVATATNKRLEFSEFFPNATATVDCGPLIYRDGECHSASESDVCTRDTSCLTFPAYLGTNIPTTVMGAEAVQNYVLLVDLSRIPSRAASMLRSIKERSAVSTAPVELIRGPGNAPGLSIWSPVFHSNDTCRLMEDCEPALRGVLTVVLLADTVQQEILASSQLESLNWVLYESETHSVLSSFLGITQAAPLTVNEVHSNQDFFVDDVHSFFFSESFSVLGRTWVFEVRATKAYIEDEISSVPTLALVFGFVATAILVSTSAIILFFQWYKVREGIRRVQARHEAELKVHETVLGYIHHELRSPLHIVTASIEEVLHALNTKQFGALKAAASSASTDTVEAAPAAAAPPLPPAQRSVYDRLREYLHEALDATSNMTRHVDDMLDFGKLRRGDFEARLESADVVQLLRRTIDGHAKLSKVPLEADMSAFEERMAQAAKARRVPVLYCETDAGRLQQLVINGLTNAMKHTATGRIVTRVNLLKRSHPLLLKLGQKQGAESEPFGPHKAASSGQLFIHVAVCDSGEGLRGKSPDSLFRPFVSYDMSTKTASSLHSTGLGLPICRTLARRLGGEVALEDTGNGCRFDVVLPTQLVTQAPKASTDAYIQGRADVASEADVALEVKDADTPAAASPGTSVTATPSDETPLQRRLRVLVVDDVPMNVKLASNMLQRNGCTVAAIGKGNFAKELESALVASGQLCPSDECQPPSYLKPAYDAVFLDIRLGQFNGLNIFTSIRDKAAQATAPHPLPPFFAMTASTTSSDTHMYGDVGFAGILAKPFRASHVKQVLAGLRSRQVFLVMR